jgi:NAD(P)-dependent dehydrogenase (short-subunit alcohol dehydrogenase family)
MTERYLEGRSAWVTGGATGMGRAIALALAARGADVAIGSLMEAARPDIVKEQSVYLLSEEEMEQTRAEIASNGVRASACSLDVGSTDSVREVFDRIAAAWGKIDILVNAAGCSARHGIADHPDELWDRVLNVNLTGAYRTSKLCVPTMMGRKWGRVINIASTAANVGALAHSAYCSSKTGLLGLTRCLALEGAAHGVSANAINPGYVATPQNSIGMRQQMRIDQIDMPLDEYRAMIAEKMPQKRWIPPSEIGELAAFLCRDEAFGITGQDLTITGGSNW